MLIMDSRRTARRTRWRRRPLAVLTALAVAVPLAVAARVVHVATRDERPRSDAIVVLGAAATNGRAGRVLAARLEHARELHAEGVAPVVVTTGGRGVGQVASEAAVGRSWLVERGVPPDAVVAVGSGGDTYSSLRAVAAVRAEAGWESVVLVSDPWHLYRTRVMADDVGLPVTGTSPVATGPNVESPERVAFNVVRETAAFLVHRSGTTLDGVGDAVDAGLDAAFGTRGRRGVSPVATMTG